MRERYERWIGERGCLCGVVKSGGCQDVCSGDLWIEVWFV